MVNLIERFNLWYRSEKMELSSIIFLIFIYLESRRCLLIISPNLYHVDSYTFLYAAKEFATKNLISYNVGFPFIVSLGMFIKMFSNIFHVIIISQFFMIFLTLILLILVYHLGVKMSGNFMGLWAGIFVIFNPYLLMYSIVPHNDIFALTLTVASLSTAITNLKKKYMFSAIFFYLSLVTRPDYGLAVLFPLILLLYISDLTRSKKEKMVNILMLFVFPSIIGYIFARSNLYKSRFTLIQSFFYFFKFSSIKIVAENLFKFSYDYRINLLILTIICFNVLFICDLNKISFNISLEKKNIISGLKQHLINLSKIKYLPISLGLFFIVYFFIIVIRGFPYTIVGHIVEIVPRLNFRRLIPLSFILSYPFGYSVYKITSIIDTNNIQIIKKNKIYIISILIFLVLFSISFMWLYGSGLSSEASKVRSASVETAEWLSNSLKENEYALVPTYKIYSIISPEIKDNLLSFESIWDSAGITMMANTSNQDVSVVGKYLSEFIRENQNYKYMIKNWVDPYANKLFQDSNVNNEIMLFFKSVKEIDVILSSGWVAKTMIFQRFNVTITDVNYYTNNIVNFNIREKVNNHSLGYIDGDGIHLNYINVKGEDINTFYLDLTTDVIEYTNLTAMQMLTSTDVTDEVAECKLQITLYFDTNNDGSFSYEADQVIVYTYPVFKDDKSLEISKYLFQRIRDRTGNIIQIGFKLVTEQKIESLKLLIHSINLYYAK